MRLEYLFPLARRITGLLFVWVGCAIIEPWRRNGDRLLSLCQVSWVTVA